MAHPDDAELWAGGTLIRHRTRGDRTVVLTFADPRDPRALESHEGARLLGAECILLEGRLLGHGHHLVDQIQRTLETLRPDTIITHWRGDSHPDHVLVQRAVVIAATHTRIAQGIPSAVFCCDTYYSQGLHGTFHPIHYIDISNTLEQKLMALSAHRSQQSEKWATMARDMAKLHGSRCGCAFAEGFRELAILGQRLKRELLPGHGT